MKPLIAIAVCIGLVAAAPAAAQRQSLAERVSALEAQASNSGGNIELLNQITQLRGELKTLRSQIEELRREQEQQAQSRHSQYLDLDSRLIRLEGGTPALPAPPPLDVAVGVTAAAAATAGNTLAAPVDETSPAAMPEEDLLPDMYGDAGALARIENEQADYLAAFDILKAGDYAGSARAFQDFLQRYPGGSYAPNALYWLGESYYVTQNYAMAEQQFQTLLDRYPSHDKAPGALLKVGFSQDGQGQSEAAIATLNAVVTRYPGSSEAATAADRLRAMQLSGNW